MTQVSSRAATSATPPPAPTRPPPAVLQVRGQLVEESGADAARLSRHAVGDRWFVDETYVKVAGRLRCLYRAVDQFGQVIDVLLSERRDTAAARRFFTRALAHGPAGRGDHR